MFDSLSKNLSSVFSRLNSRGSLSASDVNDALREVRLALLEADVALPVVKQVIARVREEAVGEKVLKAIKPGEQVIKIVHDALVDVLGDAAPLNILSAPPVVILMCGLQGSGKTTTAGKLAKLLKEKEQKDVLLASLDIYRPAAQEQLQMLAERVGVRMLDIREGEKPKAITERALKEARTTSADVLILDTAGRTELDDAMMAELKEVYKLSAPAEVLLVADALTGQIAVNIAEAFKAAVAPTGIVLTRVDGDGRGGAALSMRYVTGVPIKFVGMGEGLDKLEVFRPKGMAERILGMGDVVALVEKMQAAVEEDDAKALEKKLMSGKKMDMNDIRRQIKMMQRMGGLGGMLNLLPGMGHIKDKVNESNIDHKKTMIHQLAIIDSMTKAERANPTILNAKRRKRIAAGAGQEVSAVNKVVKMHEQMNQMTKLLGKAGGVSALGNMLKGK